MSEITGIRRMIHEEEVRNRAAVSEAVGFKLGQGMNFINEFQHSEKQLFVNGKYSRITSLPYEGWDGYVFFEYPAEIINAWMFVQNQTGAASGRTELDVERATTPGGAWTSIFSTTPKIEYNAGNGIWINKNSLVANTTAPVLSTTNVDADDALRLTIRQVPNALTAANAGAGIIIHYRPR